MSGKNQISFGNSLLGKVRQWLEAIEIRNPNVARLLCRVIPARCPFERDIKLFSHIFFHIPPLCKLNPFYEQVVGIRFRSLCYLADICGEDVTSYCSTASELTSECFVK